MSARTSLYGTRSDTPDTVSYDGVGHVLPSSSASNRRLKGGVFVELNEHIPAYINGISAGTYRDLRTQFTPLVDHIHNNLEKSQINAHHFDHQDRVAHGTFQMGQMLDLNPQDVAAVTLATRFHDIGYIFKKGIDPRTLSKRNSPELRNHPRQGAEIFLETLRNEMRRNVMMKFELAWWTDRHSELAFDAIRHHSNGSDYEPEDVHIAAKLPRLFDKADNDRRRNFSSHIEEVRQAATLRPEDAASIAGRYEHANVLASDYMNQFDRVQYKTASDVFAALQAFDQGFAHRLAPYAAEGQRIIWDPNRGEMVFEYDVDLQKLSMLLGVPMEPGHHVHLFEKAYGNSSMPIAAEVVQSIRRHIGLPVAAAEPGVTVRFNFDHDHTIERSYLPEQEQHD
jgi:hypothetical protein